MVRNLMPSDPSDSPSRASSSHPSATAAEEPPQTRSKRDEFRPVYVELPEPDEVRNGRKNLVWAVVFLVISLLLFAVALRFGSSVTAMNVGCCLATAIALSVMARTKLLREQNGELFALSLVFLLGVIISLSQEGWLAWASAPANTLASTAPATTVAASPAPAASAPALVDALSLPPPDPSRGRRVRIVHGAIVKLDGKPYAVREGDLFPLASVNDTEVHFLAGKADVAAPKEIAEILYPQRSLDEEDDQPPQKPAEPAERKANTAAAAALSMQTRSQLLRRYPAIFVQGSPENQLFVAAYKDLQRTGSTEYLQNPDWALDLAETLAKREGWQRQDVETDRQAAAEASATEVANKSAGMKDGGAEAPVQPEDATKPATVPEASSASANSPEPTDQPDSKQGPAGLKQELPPQVQQDQPDPAVSKPSTARPALPAPVKNSKTSKGAKNASHDTIDLPQH